MAKARKPLNLLSFDLLGQIADGNGGSLSTDYIIEQYGRRPLNALFDRGYINYVNYANGEHACMTDAGHAYLEQNP